MAAEGPARRRQDFATAFDVLAGMAGANGIVLPRGMQGLSAWLPASVAYGGLRWIEFDSLAVPALALAMVLAFAAPSTQQIFCHYEPAFERIFRPEGRLSFTWTPARGWSLAFAALFVGCVFSMNRVTEFLYFQF